MVGFQVKLFTVLGILVCQVILTFLELNPSCSWYEQYHGGTNFGRSAGGPFITTSYDYDAPLDEYGKIKDFGTLCLDLKCVFRKSIDLKQSNELQKHSHCPYVQVVVTGGCRKLFLLHLHSLVLRTAKEMKSD